LTGRDSSAAGIDRYRDVSKGVSQLSCDAPLTRRGLSKVFRCSRPLGLDFAEALPGSLQNGLQAAHRAQAANGDIAVGRIYSLFNSHVDTSALDFHVGGAHPDATRFSAVLSMIEIFRSE
jgi:hypothetical protein